MKRKLIAFLLVAALMASLGMTAAAGDTSSEMKPTADFVYNNVTYTVGLTMDSSGAVPGLSYIGEDGKPADLSNEAMGQKTLALGIRTTDHAGQPITVGRDIFSLISSVSVTGGESLNAETQGTHWMGWWRIDVQAPNESQSVTLEVTANLDLNGDKIAETPVVIGVPLVWSIGGSSGGQGNQPDSSNYTFQYDGETYTVGLQEWVNGESMPMTFGEGYPGGGMRMTDEDFELEYVVCIKTGEPGAEEPAHNNVFAKIESVAYTADVQYLPESAGELVMGEVTDVTRDTSEGTGNTKTKAFSISVPGTSYFDMDITATITMKLGDDSVTLTQTLNYGKPSSFIGMTTLRLDNYIDECDTTEELQSIIKDRESLWRFYAQKSGCSVDEMLDVVGDALKVYLPTGIYNDLSFDLSDQVVKAADIFGLDAPKNDWDLRMNGPIILVGSGKADGTTLGSLTCTGADGTGMSWMSDLHFDAEYTQRTENTYGYKVTGALTDNGNDHLWASCGPNNSTFTGYGKAIWCEGNGCYTPNGCTFTGNEIAVYINCGDGANVYSDLTHCTFINNETAVYLQSLGTSCSPYSFRVTMCDFIGNDTEVNYQPAGKFYLFNNYYGTVDGKLKRKAAVVEGEDTTVKQGVWRDKSFKSDVTGYGIADGGVVINNDGKVLNDEYLEAVTFDVIASDTENSETLGTWTFE